MKPSLAAAILLLLPSPAFGHRLDEYLQGTLISVGKDSLQAELTLTPGVAVFPFVSAGIDTNRDGIISGGEQQAYALRILRDLSFSIDGRPLLLELRSIEFPNLADMKEGLGGIRLKFTANVPRGGQTRRLMFENHHQPRLSAYLVNCLVPDDSDIRVIAQVRNESQSVYQLDYTQAGPPPNRAWLVPLALLLFTRFAFLQFRRGAGSFRKRRV
ncbi:MAG TPA: hypothetical protein VKU01_23180 [Bryobacteraceae bacterium]|nr:hypothetical protein [Bryobacteraceae bacterium]